MSRKKHLLSSITRLVVGGMLVTIEEMDARFPKWESHVDISPRHTSVVNGREPDHTVPEPSQPMHDGLFGAIIALEDRIDDRLDGIDQLTRRGANQTKMLLKPFTDSWLGKRIAQRLDRWAERGEQEIKRLARYGRFEVEQSKAVFRTAVSTSVDEALVSFSDNPEIQQLVQTQGVTLAEEVVDEMRERTVSADNYLEMFTRNVLNRPTRDQLPEPPQVVKEQSHALYFQKARGKKR